MGLYVRQNEQRTKLQERLQAELSEKAKKKPLGDMPREDIDDSLYLKDTKTTTGLAGVWVAIAIASIALVIWLVVRGPQV